MKLIFKNVKTPFLIKDGLLQMILFTKHYFN